MVHEYTNIVFLDIIERGIKDSSKAYIRVHFSQESLNIIDNTESSPNKICIYTLYPVPMESKDISMTDALNIIDSHRDSVQVIELWLPPESFKKYRRELACVRRPWGVSTDRTDSHIFANSGTFCLSIKEDSNE